MFSAIGSVVVIFLVGVVSNVDSGTARLPYAIGVVLFVAVLLAARFQFRVRYRLKIAGKNVKTSEPIPQEWIDAVSGDRESSDP